MAGRALGGVNCAVRTVAEEPLERFGQCHFLSLASNRQQRCYHNRSRPFDSRPMCLVRDEIGEQQPL